MIRKAELKDLRIINQFLDRLYNPHIDEETLLNHPFSRHYLLIIDQVVVGFLSYSIIYDKIELNYIYIIDEYRRRGYAKKLMNFLIEEAAVKKCLNISLEVNINNKVAISLYQNFGFIEGIIKPHYYGLEDGMLMIRKQGE